MPTLHTPTVMVVGLLLTALCFAVTVQLWRRSIGRLRGIGQGALAIGLMLAAQALLMLRGVAPDWLSIVLANTLLVQATWMSYRGVQRYAGLDSPQWPNYLVITAVAAGLTYYLYVSPSMTARFTTFSAGLFVMAVQGAYMTLACAEPRVRRLTRPLGWAYAGYAMVALLRITDGLVSNPPGRELFTAGPAMAVSVLVYLVMFLALTFFLQLAVNAGLMEQAVSSEERFRKAFLAAPYGIGLIRRGDGVLLDLNESAARLLGTDRDSLVGAHVSDLNWVVDPSRKADPPASVIASDRVEPFETRLRRDDGTAVDVLVSTEALDLADEPHTMFGFIDVTDLRRSEDALRLSEETYRLLAEMTRDAIVLHDLDGVIRYANPAGLALVGATEGDLGSLRLDTLLLPERASDMAVRRDLRLTGDLSAMHYEVEIAGAAGRRIYLSVSSMPVMRDGQMDGILLVARDITEMKQAELQHQEVQAQLAQAERMETVGLLAGGVAHDLNNLLTGILNFVEMARSNLEADHPVMAHLDAITQDAKGSVQMAGHLLAFARRHHASPQVFDLNVRIAGLMATLSRIVGYDVRTVWSLTPLNTMVRMDPTQLDQVLLNLVANARSAMPDGGTLTIETGVTDNPWGQSLWGQEPALGGFVVLKVSDTGAGMTKEVQSRLFEPFFTTRSVGEGAGLGLATVYGIVKQSGGSVTVESEPGHGAVFRVFLPICNEVPQAEPVTPAPPAPAAGERADGGARILVVDDDRVIRRSISLFLRGAGYSVQEADRPEEALAIAAADPGSADLLVTDINMPVMTGPELARKVLIHRPQMRCILVSGYGADEVAGDPGTAGMGFLMKPFSKAQLLAAVRAQLEG